MIGTNRLCFSSGLFGLLGLAVGCGSPSTISTPEDNSSTSSVAAPDSSVVTANTDVTGESVVVTTGVVVESGGVALELPVGSFSRELPGVPEPSDFVIETSLWRIPNGTLLRVTLQSIEPNVDTEPDMVVDGTGLSWQVYDVGFENGSELIARAPVPDGWLLVVLGQPNYDATDASWDQLQEILQTTREA